MTYNDYIKNFHHNYFMNLFHLCQMQFNNKRPTLNSLTCKCQCKTTKTRWCQINEMHVNILKNSIYIPSVWDNQNGRQNHALWFLDLGWKYAYLRSTRKLIYLFTIRTCQSHNKLVCLWIAKKTPKLHNDNNQYVSHGQTETYVMKMNAVITLWMSQNIKSLTASWRPND
jgi:hypothetical protein